MSFVSKTLVSSTEFTESWNWLLDHISIDLDFIEDYGYHFDHKYWKFQDENKCIDKCENGDSYLAKLYLVSQLTPVSDYLPVLKNQSLLFSLEYPSLELDSDVARVINSQETTNHLNSFRNSLSEHLAFWTMLASIIKCGNYQEFAITKPNLQPEDKGPDGLAYIIFGTYSIVKIISVKNSIQSPQELISSANFRRNMGSELDNSKMLDELFSFKNHNRGFHRLDEKLNSLLQESRQQAEDMIRRDFLANHSQFNATVVADDLYAKGNLFIGFNQISNEPKRCIGIYIGSENWINFANRVQSKAKEILSINGILY